MSEWCEHIYKYKPVQPKKHIDYTKIDYYEGQYWSGADVERFKFCPICGTPRPEVKKKELFEIVKETYENNYQSGFNSNNVYILITYKLIEEIIDRVDKDAKVFILKTPPNDSIEFNLKSYLKEILK